MSVRPDAEPKAMSNARIIATSFAAGVGVMVLVGLVAPTAAMGGLSLRSAAAATIEQRAPLIEPLDVNAISAQLEQSQGSIDEARRASDPVIAELERLASR